MTMPGIELGYRTINQHIMTHDVIKSYFTFPLNTNGLKEGSDKDYTIKVSIGGGKKSTTIKFADPSHREKLRPVLEKAARDHDVDLELDIAA